MARNILKLLLNLFLLIVIISQFAINSISVAKESGNATKKDGGQQENYSNASLYGSLPPQLLLRNKRMENKPTKKVQSLLKQMSFSDCKKSSSNSYIEPSRRHPNSRSSASASISSTSSHSSTRLSDESEIAATVESSNLSNKMPSYAQSFLVDEQENDGNYGQEGSRPEQGNKAQSLLDRLDPPKSHSSRHGTVPMPPKQERRKVASLFDQDGDDNDEDAVQSREMAPFHRQDSLGRKKVDSLLAESLIVETDRQGRAADKPMAPGSRKKADSLLAKKYATSLFIDGKGMESGGGGGPSTGKAASILNKTKAESLLDGGNKSNRQYATSLFDNSAAASSSFGHKQKVPSLLNNDDDDNNADRPASWQPNPALRRSASTRQSSGSNLAAQSLLGDPAGGQTAIRGEGGGRHRRLQSSAGFVQKNETEYLLIPHHATGHGQQSSSGGSKSGTEYLLLDNNKDYFGHQQDFALSPSHPVYTVQLKWDYWLQPNRQYVLAFYNDFKENTLGMADDKYDKVKFRFNCLIETNENGQFGLTQMRIYAGCQHVKDYFRFAAVVYPKNNKSDKRILNYFEHAKDLKNYDKDKYPLNPFKTKNIINFDNLVSPKEYYETELEDCQKKKMGMKEAFYEQFYADI